MKINAYNDKDLQQRWEGIMLIDKICISIVLIIR